MFEVSKSDPPTKKQSVLCTSNEIVSAFSEIYFNLFRSPRLVIGQSAGLFKLLLPLKEFGSFKTSMNKLNKDRCHSNKMSLAVALFYFLLLD